MKELAERILTRFARLETERSAWTRTWQELCEYVLPRRDSFSGHAAGSKTAGDERIFDSTATHAVELLSAALNGMLTNPSSPWFDLRVRRDDLRDSESVRRFLDEARKRMLVVFGSDESGFQAQVHELYLDLVLLGTSVMHVEPDPECLCRFSTRPLGECWISESCRGAVDAVFRRYELTARQAFQEWGMSLSEDVCRQAEDSPDSRVEIVHAVYPRSDRDPASAAARDMPWASVYVEVSARQVIEEGGCMEMPYMVPRWSKAAGEVYGRGPGLSALSDVRVLNAMGKTALMAAQKMADPTLMVPDDGFLGPTVTTPGGLNYYRAGTSDRIEPIPVGIDLRAAQVMMEQKREAIRRIFLNDQLQMVGSPAMTATEVMARQEEKMRILGPVLGRMQAEFLGPLVRRVFGIMLRSGALGELPPQLRGGEWDVEFVSPIARAQRAEEAQSMLRVMEFLGPFMAPGDPFGVLDNFDVDAVVRGTVEIFGVPERYCRPRDEVAAVREVRSQAQQAAAAKAEAKAEAEETLDGAKRLSEIEIREGTALGEVIKSLPGLLAAGEAAAEEQNAGRAGVGNKPNG